MAINMVILDGTLTRDAEQRDVGSGLVSLNLYHEGPQRTGRDGEPWRKQMYVSVCVWGSAGEPLAGLKEGAYVIVQGELEYRSWETNDGEKRGQHQVNATAVTVGSAPVEMPAVDATPATVAAATAPATGAAQDEIPF